MNYAVQVDGTNRQIANLKFARHDNNRSTKDGYIEFTLGQHEQISRTIL